MGETEYQRKNSLGVCVMYLGSKSTRIDHVMAETAIDVFTNYLTGLKVGLTT